VESLLKAKLRKVTAATMSSNLGMMRIMEKCGMNLEATQKAQEILNGVAVDILYFAKFSKSFEGP
jgi:RimJ/RimL family protein N-acetyltransferase